MNKEYEKFGHPTRYLKKTLMRRQQGACVDCGIHEYERDDNFQVHRRIKDGEYSPDNCVMLCSPCHNKRHYKGEL